ncbi:potassium channel family protein [Psychromicrobium xiongbiense]|uniref:potassium channel family protein n=1 Tax=Psychromicrobium xiongbiense TaxID=3051184 RepID=UPI0025556A34|nr:potassium channel family protein [Psychromicrobium sp. YIM S02556]
MKSTSEVRQKARRIETAVLVIASVAVAVLFLAVPLDLQDGTGSWLIVVAIAAALLFLAALVRMILRGARLFRLINLLITVVIAFSVVFYVVAVHFPGQFDGISTRIDALYFTLTTMTTAGYGDIHPTGQLARVLVSSALVFDVVFLGMLGSELSRRVSRRNEAQHR